MEVGLSKRMAAYILSKIIFGFLCNVIIAIIFIILPFPFLGVVLPIITFLVLYIVMGDVGKRIMYIKVVDENGNDVKNIETLFTSGFSLLYIIDYILVVIGVFIPSLASIAFMSILIIAIVFVVLFFMNKPFWRTIAKQRLVVR